MSKKPEKHSAVEDALRDVRKLSRKRATGRSQQTQQQDTSAETGAGLTSEPDFEKDYLAKEDSDAEGSDTALSSIEKHVPVEWQTAFSAHRADVKEILSDHRWDVVKWVGGILLAAFLAIWGIVSTEVGGLRSDVREDIGALRSAVESDVGEVMQDMRHFGSRLDTLERQVLPLETEEQ